MLRYLLELGGHDVRLACSGKSGLATAVSWRPEIIFSDLTLPGELDGYGVARALRMNPSARSAFLVALSGNGRDQDKLRARAAGFNLHVLKPIDLETLEKVVAFALHDDAALGAEPLR